MPTVQEILGAIKGDPTRQRNIDQTVARARGGDPQALAILRGQASGAATGDAQDYARLRLSELTGQQANYVPLGNARFNVQKALGSALKIGAPIAALAIPGVGPLAAAAIGAGGSAAGKALRGEKVSLGDVAQTAIGTGVGRAALGSGGLAGAKAALSSGGGPDADLAGEGAITSGGGGGILGAVGNYVRKNPLDAARLGLAGLSTLQSAKTASRANRAVQVGLDRANAPLTPIDLAALFPSDSPYRKRPTALGAN